MRISHTISLLVGVALWQCNGGAANATEASEPASSVTHPSAAQSDVYFDTDPRTWGRLIGMKQPIYPKEALAAGIGSDVTVEVGVDILGRVTRVHSIKSSPTLPAFEDAVRDVVHQLRFQVPLMQNCVPKALETVGVVMRFSVADGKPKILLSHASDASHAVQNRSERNATPTVMRNKAAILEAMRYPTNARRVGAQAIVYVMLTIDPKSGKPLETRVTHVVTAKGMEIQFRQSVEAALEQAEFEPQPRRRAPIRVCVPFYFQLTD